MRLFLSLMFITSVSFANDTADALQRLVPGAEWSLSGDSYEGIKWLDSRPMPSRSEFNAALQEVMREKNRKYEYPSLEEMVKALIVGGKTLDDLKQKIADIDAKYP